MDIDNVFGLFGFGKDKNKNQKLEIDYLEEFRILLNLKLGCFIK